MNIKKPTSLRGKWLFNSFLMVVLVVLILEAICIAFIVTSYKSNVSKYLSDISNTNTVMANIVQSKSQSQSQNEENVLNDYVLNLPQEIKNTTEIELIDSNGKIILTSTGFMSTNEFMPDYVKAAAQGSSGTCEMIGFKQGDEKVSAITHMIILPNSVDKPYAIRFVSSMSNINSQMALTILVAIAIGIGIILLSSISGWYFINSIVKPIDKVNAATRSIAHGDFATALPIIETNEIGQLCESINYMAGRLKETEQLKNDFISSVSHELRTPLTAIKGWGETVKESVDDDPEMVDKGLSVILAEADRLSILVEDLLDFSRLQAGRMDIPLDPVDILPEVAAVVLTYQESAKRQGINVIFIHDKTLPLVNGNKQRLRQVFVNIIDNAIKYSTNGDTVKISATSAESFVNVCVADSGCGIAKSDLLRVKEKFYKANNTVRGSGIGLAVANDLVEHHGGKIHIESEENIGTTVTIELPVLFKERKNKN